jgi:hypothetical protein
MNRSQFLFARLRQSNLHFCMFFNNFSESLFMLYEESLQAEQATTAEGASSAVTGPAPLKPDTSPKVPHKLKLLAESPISVPAGLCVSSRMHHAATKEIAGVLSSTCR